MAITYDKVNLKAKASEYCKRHGSRISYELGFGTQGVVYKTEHNTALKVYDLKQGYCREKAIYHRLRDRQVFVVNGMNIPRIVGWDDDLMAFEMSIVHVPCVLDFGGAYLDKAPEHMVRDDMWFEQKKEEFGKHWDEAQAVIREIEYRADIYLADVNSGNIKFTPS